MPTGGLALARHTRLLAILGLAGVLAFVGSVLLLHASIPRQPWHMSEFANTRLGALWALGVLGFAAGGVALIFAMRPTIAGGFWRRLGLGMFWAASAGAFMLAIFPVDKDADNPTLPGIIHEEVGPPTFVLSGAAMMVLVPAFRAYRAWRPFAIASLTLGVLVVASALAYVAYTHQGVGQAAVAQRVMVGLICTWFVLAGVRLLRLPTDPMQQGPPRDVGLHRASPAASTLPLATVLLSAAKVAIAPTAPVARLAEGRAQRSPATASRRTRAGKRPAAKAATTPRLRARKVVALTPRRRPSARRASA